MKHATLKLMVSALSVFALVVCAANAPLNSGWVMLLAFGLFALPIAVGQAAVIIFAVFFTPAALPILLLVFGVVDVASFAALQAAEKESNRARFARVDNLKVPANNIPRGM